MSRHTLLLQSTCCAAAIAGSFLLGRATSPSGGALGAAAAPTRTVRLAADSPLGSRPISAAATPEEAAQAALAARLKAPTPEQAQVRLKAIFENSDPVGRMTDFLGFLKTLDSNEARSAALGTLMENFNPRERARELNMLMSQWAGADPAAALASVKDSKEWPGQMAASTVLTKWVASNPDAAIAWATENGKAADQTENGNYYMVGLLGALAKTDLDRAATLAQSMNRSRARGDAMDRVLDQYLTQRSPEATQAWAASLGASPFKDGVQSRLAGRLADKDAPAAAAWASTLPDSENKPKVLSEVVQRWSREQPNEAGAWLNQFPASPATDEPREAFAMQVQKSDPEAAIAWAATITDAERRERATRDLLRSWSEREPEQARQWVDSSQLSPRLKQRYGTKPNG